MVKLWIAVDKNGSICLFNSKPVRHYSMYANVGFLGCASKEIAQHFGEYFGMLITEAKYGDMVDFKIIKDN